MTSALVLDTCVLPRSGTLDGNPLLAALLRVAALRDLQVVLPALVATESVSARRRSAEAALAKTRSALTLLQKAFGTAAPDYYLPGVSVAVERWEDDLKHRCTVLPLHGDDAIEALSREAYRRAPARSTSDDSATGARDAAIWLTAARWHRENDGTTTYFVSSNTRDFADTNEQHKLRAELLLDLADCAESFYYFPSLAAAIEALADETAELLAPEEALTSASAVGAEGCIEELVRASWPRENVPLDLRLELLSARETHAFIVDGTRLARLTIAVRVTDEADAATTVGDARLWYQRTGTEPGTSDCESFRWQ